MFDLDVKLSKYFRWKEVLGLPYWKLFMVPNKAQMENLITVCSIADEIRESIIKEPMFITSGLRASSYNGMIDGAKNSAHLYGQALDFFCKHKSADEVRALLEPELERLKIRMEKLPGSDWVHIDIREPGIHGRYFIP